MQWPVAGRVHGAGKTVVYKPTSWVLLLGHRQTSDSPPRVVDIVQWPQAAACTRGGVMQWPVAGRVQGAMSISRRAGIFVGTQADVRLAA